MRYTNNDLIKAFANGEISGKAGNLAIANNYLYSYRTVIAIRLKTGAVLLNTKSYSRTTTTHQNKVKAYCIIFNTVDNEEDLIKQYNKIMKEVYGIES